MLSSPSQCRENQAHQGVFASLCGGARGRVTPGSIPNPEVKPPIADDTIPVWYGKVGRCHIENNFFFIISHIFFYYCYFNYPRAVCCIFLLSSHFLFFCHC